MFLKFKKGKFLLATSVPRITQFSSELQFKEELLLENDKFYEFEFSYVINTDVCERNDLQLQVYLFDPNFFKQILFEYNATSEEVKNDRWNTEKICFQVLGRSYELFLSANSSCSKDNKAFIAIDEIIIRETNENDETECKDIRITEFPETTTTTTVEDVTTSQEINTEQFTTSDIIERNKSKN